METINTATRFEIIPALRKELAEETAITRRFLERVPDDKRDWAPHPKSMKMGDLAMHIADLPSWINLGVNTDELDFAKMSWEPKSYEKNADLLALFDQSVEAGNAALDAADADRFEEPWLLRTADKIHARMTRFEMIRHAYSQMAHHRAQLGVYFRLLDIPVPGTYGPSADEMDF
jgi:uncharacterized damage-inducible protein DinB